MTLLIFEVLVLCAFGFMFWASMNVSGDYYRDNEVDKAIYHMLRALIFLVFLLAVIFR